MNTKPTYVYVIVNVVEGRAVIAYPTYVEARLWKSRATKPDNYRIDYIPLM